MYDDLQLVIQSTLNLDIDLIESPEINLTISEGGGSPLPYYEGSYEVTPRKIEQLLETKNKSMLDDVTINAINYAEVANPQGGKTATIGFE